MTKHVGTTIIDRRYLLEMIGLENGELLDVQLDENGVSITIEHPDMPECEFNEIPKHVGLVFTTKQNTFGKIVERTGISIY